MKRSTQLIAESVIVAMFLIVLTIGGTVESLNVPSPWASVQNANSATTQTDLSSIALYYNNTLTYLAQGQYGNASLYLNTFSFANIPTAIVRTADTANNEISSMNITIPVAVVDFTNATILISLNEFQNATFSAQAGCFELNTAAQNFVQFANSTTPSLSRLGVPVSLYSIGERRVDSLITGLIADCNHLHSKLGTGNARLLIWSPQSSIETGGSVVIKGNLSLDSNPVGGQKVYFYLNNTYIGSTNTDTSGNLSSNVVIPYVYYSTAAVTAYIVSNSSISLTSVQSNILYFTILFNQTQIVVGDPPSYLPTESFSVSGYLNTTTGAPVPLAPVAVTFLNITNYATTNSLGQYRTSFVVPANATDGVYAVSARFHPTSGSDGPSTNFTTIQIVREVVNLSLSSPSLSFAGFNSKLSGFAETKNGTQLSNATVLVSSPWGNYRTATDGSGNFAITVPVPFWEFAFKNALQVTLTPAQPFVETTQAIASLSIFNFLWILVPGIIVGLGFFEVRNLGLMPDLRKSLARRRAEASQISEADILREEAMSKIFPPGYKPHRIVEIYLEALNLTNQKFPGFRIKESITIREVSNLVDRRIEQEKENLGAGRSLDNISLWGQLFDDVSSATEEYLYSAHFDSRLTDDPENWLGELKSLWEKGGGP